ncbi:MAG TPA: hypothetical protein VMT17_19290 [Anaeromyxobacteraceae bacterium]|nr:hypothetical protein [Anaeromyxobacteraceae bacterium]
MDLNALATEVAATIKTAGRVEAIFGRPVRLGRHAIIPVALVQASLGGGGGGLSLLSGGGGGFNLQVVPVGYLIDGGGKPIFKPIPLPLEALQLGRGDARWRTVPKSPPAAFSLASRTSVLRRRRRAS